jgi:hypothetical protein
VGLIAVCALGIGGSLRLARDLPSGVDVVDGGVPDTALPEPAPA